MVFFIRRIIEPWSPKTQHLISPLQDQAEESWEALRKVCILGGGGGVEVIMEAFPGSPFHKLIVLHKSLHAAWWQKTLLQPLQDVALLFMES